MSEPFVGEIKMVGFNFAPRGFATCSGQTLPIQQNAALFSLLGTTYGGNGQTTFQLPNLQGRSPVGVGNGAGLTPITIGEISGTENVTLLQTQMPSHTHAASAAVAVPANTTSTTLAATPSATSVLGPIAAGGRAGTLYTADAATTTLLPFNAAVTVQATGGSQPLPVRNPFLGTNFVIALTGIFPSRD